MNSSVLISAQYNYIKKKRLAKGEILVIFNEIVPMPKTVSNTSLTANSYPFLSSVLGELMHESVRQKKKKKKKKFFLVCFSEFGGFNNI